MARRNEDIHVMYISPTRSVRTLADAVESLPFHAPLGNPQIEAGALPNDGLPELHLPNVEDDSARSRR
jgi:hypothetical protein